MNITDVKTHIKNKKIQSYYIFAGDEIEVQRIYINKIAEVLGYEVVRADCISDVWPSIITPTLFDKPCVYVVRDDKDLLQDEKLNNNLTSDKLNGNVIINLITTVDKRTKWYKANSDKIVLFERLSDEVLIKYIQRITTLNRRNCERLIAICDSDYSQILLEIDKIKRFNNDNHNEAFEQLLSEGAIYQPPKDAIFDLVDAILKRQIDRVYNLFEQCKEIGEANLVILSVLYKNTKQVLQVQACESSDICNSTGLTSWQVRCAKDKCGNYSIGELVNILKLIQKIQKGILTGQIEDSMSVEYLLVNIL